MKPLSKLIKPECGEPCECCGEPTYDPFHRFAVCIFDLIPANGTSSAAAQKAYDSAVDIIKEALADTADQAVGAFIDEMESDERVVN